MEGVMNMGTGKVRCWSEVIVELRRDFCPTGSGNKYTKKCLQWSATIQNILDPFVFDGIIADKAERAQGTVALR